MAYLAQLLVVMTDWLKIVTICGFVLEMCIRTRVDSNINDRLVKLHPLVHLTCFEFMWIIVVSYSEGRLFHITHLVNCMYLAHSIELINQI